jgi:hypothetical protein
MVTERMRRYLRVGFALTLPTVVGVVVFSMKMGRAPYEPVAFPHALAVGLLFLMLPRLVLARGAVGSRVLQGYFLAVGLGEMAVLLGFHGSGQGAMLFMFLALIDIALCVPALGAIRAPRAGSPVARAAPQNPSSAP